MVAANQQQKCPTPFCAIWINNRAFLCRDIQGRAGTDRAPTCSGEDARLEPQWLAAGCLVAREEGQCDHVTVILATTRRLLVT